MDMPHRVAHGGSNRFYVRHSTVTIEASITELRRMFELSGNEFDKAERFCTERIARIAGDKVPCRLEGKANGYHVLHIVPFGYNSRTTVLDLSRFEDGMLWSAFVPIRSGLARKVYCADGFAVCDSGDHPHAYTLITRGAALEAVGTDIVMVEVGTSSINAAVLRDDVRDSVAKFLRGLVVLGAQGPWIVSLTVCGARGARVEIPSPWKSHPLRVVPLADDAYRLPSALLEAKHINPSEAQEALRPMFDALWQAAGQPRMS
jgi:hypothetical protein